ncbi:MAG: DNA-directed RNA polymerase subunit H [Euryarchaeota archaeon]|nr:DNA-directed RNA polymerase subunit H [Euryarchaeota archaeon]
MSEEPETVQVFNVLNHELVPVHEVLDEDEAKALMARYGVKEDQLPKIQVADPAARAAGARPGDIIRVVRMSPTAGKAVAYRFVVEY